MNYSTATFRIVIDDLVQVEVSIRGCEHDRQAVSPEKVRAAARTVDRIARAVRKIQQQSQTKTAEPQEVTHAR